MLRSCTLLALSICSVASASAAGMDRDVHSTHAKTARVYVTLVNKGSWFRDVKINGRIYTVLPGELLAVKAPVGTTVYAASSFGRYHAGDLILELTPSVDHNRVSIQ
jgi:hypothetical protein